jgi:NADPH:quinone reductase-like Zn-dependent oxidoreductase
MSYQEAAAVPLAAMTAWQALQPSMPLQGKRVLVHAGAGGVGHYAIQVRLLLSAWPGRQLSCTTVPHPQ